MIPTNVVMLEDDKGLQPADNAIAVLEPRVDSDDAEERDRDA